MSIETAPLLGLPTTNTETRQKNVTETLQAEPSKRMVVVVCRIANVFLRHHTWNHVAKQGSRLSLRLDSERPDVQGLSEADLFFTANFVGVCSFAASVVLLALPFRYLFHSNMCDRCKL